MRAATPAPPSPPSKEQAPWRGPAPARGEEAEERRREIEERRAPPGLEAGAHGGRHRLSRGAVLPRVWVSGVAPSHDGLRGAGHWESSGRVRRGPSFGSRRLVAGQARSPE